MKFTNFVKLTRRRLVTILLCTLLGVAAGVGLLLTTPATYTASATAYVRVSVASSTNGSTDNYYSLPAGESEGEGIRHRVHVTDGGAAGHS